MVPGHRRAFYSTEQTHNFLFIVGTLENLPNNLQQSKEADYMVVVWRENVDDEYEREHLVLVSSFLVLTLENQIDPLLRSAIQIESSLGSHALAVWCCASTT